MPTTYGVGVLGLGHWYSGFGLARGLSEYPRAKLVAVADRNEAHAREFGETFGCDWYTDYDALIARDDIHIVHIAPPAIDIPECTLKSATAGKHMVMGKPMAMTVAKAKEMVEKVNASGVVCVPFQVGQTLRGGSMKARIDAGDIGDIIIINNRGQWGIAEDWFHSGEAGWFGDPTMTPGGALIDEGIYSVQQMMWLANSPVATIQAWTANLIHKDIGVEDWGLAVLTFSNGIRGTIEAGWTTVSPRRTGPSPKENSFRRVEIIGTRGQIIQDPLWLPGYSILAKDAPGWVMERPGGDRSAPASPGLIPYVIDCIEKGRRPSGTIDDAYKAFVVAMAAYESAKLGKPVVPQG